MHDLPDLVWPVFIRHMSLNDRASLRLVNKRLRGFVDSIKIRKLIIAERNWPLLGVLEHTGESYDVGDTAAVMDLNLFFTNSMLLKQMDQIKTLVIYGEKESAVQISSFFNHLTHLELHNLEFTDLTVLSSPNLQTLVLNRVQHIRARIETSPEAIQRIEEREGYPMFVLLSGLDYVKSKHIKHFRIDRELNQSFLQHCIGSGLFDSVQRLSVTLSGGLDRYVYLSRNCPALKRIDLNWQPCILSRAIANGGLRGLSRELMVLDVSLFVYGLLYCEATEELIKSVTSNFVETGWELIMESDYYHFYPNRYLDLEKFGRFVDGFAYQTYQPAVDTEFFKMLRHRKEFRLGFSKHLTDCTERYLRGFSGLKKLRVDLPFEFDAYALMVEFLQRNEYLEVLEFQIWQHYFEFDFLLKFPLLKNLDLISGCPIKGSVIVDLLRVSKRLNHMELLAPEDFVEKTTGASGEFEETIRKWAEHRKLQFDTKHFPHTSFSIVHNQLTNGKVQPIDSTYSDLNRLIIWLNRMEDKEEDWL